MVSAISLKQTSVDYIAIDTCNITSTSAVQGEQLHHEILNLSGSAVKDYDAIATLGARACRLLIFKTHA